MPHAFFVRRTEYASSPFRPPAEATPATSVSRGAQRRHRDWLRGTILRLLDEWTRLEIYWLVFGAHPTRANEAANSAHLLLGERTKKRIVVKGFPGWVLPVHRGGHQGRLRGFETHLRSRCHLHALPSRPTPGPPAGLRIDLEHFQESPDPRIRDHQVRWRSGHAQPVCPIGSGDVPKESDTHPEVFPDPGHRAWFTDDTFYSLLRIRGVESQSPSHYAEAFYCRKLVL